MQEASKREHFDKLPIAYHKACLTVARMLNHAISSNPRAIPRGQNVLSCRQSTNVLHTRENHVQRLAASERNCRGSFH